MTVVEQKLARQFSENLSKELDQVAFRKMVKLSGVTTDEGICVSHDFCDANMVMDEAFTSVMDYDAEFSSDHDMRLWHSAWKLAIDNGFYAHETIKL